MRPVQELSGQSELSCVFSKGENGKKKGEIIEWAEERGARGTQSEPSGG